MSKNADEKNVPIPPRENVVRAIAMAPAYVARDSGVDSGTSGTATTDGLGTMRGHFSVFNQWTEINSYWEGRFMERIAPGAFKKTFKENRDGMRVLFQHGQDFQIGDKPLGPIEDLREDKDGAYYEVPLLNTSYNRDLEPGLQAGLYGASFRFQVMKEEFVAKPGVSADNPDGLPERTIKEAKVMEFGPVTFPAYEGASAGMRSSTVRSLTDAYVLGQITRDPVRLREVLEKTLAVRSDEEPSHTDEDASLEGAGERSEETEANEDEIREDPAPDATAEDALPTGDQPDGAEAEPHSEDGSRGLAPATDTASETTQAPKPKERNSQMKTIEELREREGQIQQRFTDIHSEFGASVLPDDVRGEWNTLMGELKDVREAIQDFEARTRQLASVATDRRYQEDPTLADYRTVNTMRGRKGVPDNIFAVEEYRNHNRNMEELRTAYRDGAMAAVERSSFPHPDVDTDKARAHIQKLLDTRDDQQGTFAQRVITTGSPVYSRAFGKALRGSPLSADEQRALSLGSDADGGFAVPVQLDPTVILTSNGVVNPLRQMARVEQIVGKEWQGVTSDGVTVTRTSEGDEATDDSPTLEQPTVRVNRVQGFIPFSVEIGQDWNALQSEMAVLLADGKDTEEADSFVLGDGIGTNANGIVTKLANGSLVATTTDNVFAIADLYKLEEAVPPRFRARAQFLANRAIYNKVRQFDTYGGAALWVRLMDGLGSELVGYPARESSSMASTVADAAKILLLGDFRNFLIVDRIGMSVELIPHLFGDNGRPTGQRGIYAIWRNNSKILVDNAFRLLKVA